MSGAGYIALTIKSQFANEQDPKLVLSIDAIESIEDLSGREYFGGGTYVRTRSGAGHNVREPYEPLAAMLLERGRELSPAEAEATRERVRGGG